MEVIIDHRTDGHAVAPAELVHQAWQKQESEEINQRLAPLC
jgi:hypothetical protein